MAFAEHGPGKMPLSVVEQVEKKYLQYRENYNSFPSALNKNV